MLAPLARLGITPVEGLYRLLTAAKRNREKLAAEQWSSDAQWVVALKKANAELDAGNILMADSIYTSMLCKGCRIPSNYVNVDQHAIISRAYFNAMLIREDFREWDEIIQIYGERFDTSTFSLDRRQDFSEFENFALEFSYCRALFYTGNKEALLKRWPEIYKFIRIRTDGFKEDPIVYTRFIEKCINGLLMVGDTTELPKFIAKYLRGNYQAPFYKKMVTDIIFEHYAQQTVVPDTPLIRKVIVQYDSCLRQAGNTGTRDSLLHNIAIACKLIGEYTEGIQAIDQLSNKGPLNWKWLFTRNELVLGSNNQAAIIRANAAMLDIMNGKLELQMDTFSRYTFYHQLGDLQVKSGNDWIATDYYVRANRLETGFQEAAVKLVGVLYNLAAYTQVESYAKQILRIEPRNTKVMIYLASAFANLNKESEYKLMVAKLRDEKVEIPGAVTGFLKINMQ
jgi:tetratricopeptide (TPR) repeat protein